MGQLGWIDFSPTQRAKTMTVLDLLSESGTVDELGVGIIRDALADLIFPGLSTVQTRAKYFLFIPYIIHEYKRLRLTEKIKLSDYLRDWENYIMDILTEKQQEKETIKQNGIIGRRVAALRLRGKKVELARKPSSIYWNGLRTHGIINTNMSLSAYVASLDTKDKSLLKILKSKDAQSDDHDALAESNNELIHAPDLPEDWSDNLQIPLTKPEAEYLNHRFTHPISKENNLLKEILEREEFQEIFSAEEIKSYQDLYQKLPLDNLPKHLRDILDTAILFSELVYGAHLTYNIAVQRKLKNEEQEAIHIKSLIEWQKNAGNNAAASINLSFLWEITKYPAHSTQNFVNTWKTMVLASDFSIEEAIRFIAKREINKKGKRARLYSTTIPESTVKWVGLQYLDYRYTTAKIIITDILNPIN